MRLAVKEIRKKIRRAPPFYYSCNKQEQQHLSYIDRVNLGSYYTAYNYVSIVWDMIRELVRPDTIILDSACGYGNFLNNSFAYSKIGCDIDRAAIEVAKSVNRDARFIWANSLKDVSREKFKINDASHLVVIGNPPYNDKTSLIRHDIKSKGCAVDKAIASRDLGMSFLLSYNELKADFVCVLHPLSYLIKRTNLKSLREFTSNYRLVNALLINSQVFSQSSKSTHFPIVIALYERNASRGELSYERIRRFVFRSIDNNSLRLADFDYVTNYIKKYPSKNNAGCLDPNSVFFWTMRDINALKRNRTFVSKFSENTIIIPRNKLEYYVYVDVFKRFAGKLPYYMGNCDVMIDTGLFKQYKEYFISDSINNHAFLARHFAGHKRYSSEETGNKIDEYFHKLLGEHIAD